jgi:hypothetical protein
MIEKKLERVEAPNDPNRCQSSGAGGQCPYKAQPGSQFCHRHSGSEQSHQRREKVRMYRLNQYQARVNEISDNDQIKSLREEIGILRMTLETVINSCKSEAELIIYSGRISDMVVKIEKLVNTCQRLEISTGEMMDKTKALTLAGTIVSIIGKYVTNAEAIDNISNEILMTILGPQE